MGYNIVVEYLDGFSGTRLNTNTNSLNYSTETWVIVHEKSDVLLVQSHMVITR